MKTFLIKTLIGIQWALITPFALPAVLFAIATVYFSKALDYVFNTEEFVDFNFDIDWK